MAIIGKHEQILDGLERQVLTPKTAEQMNQNLKGIVGIARLQLKYLDLIAHFKGKTPAPTNPVLKSIVGVE